MRKIFVNKFFTRLNGTDLNKKGCPSCEGQPFIISRKVVKHKPRGYVKKRADLADKSFRRFLRSPFAKR